MNIGKTFRTIRKQKGISQVELAMQCDLSQTTISQIEKGDTLPSQATINKICNVLKLPAPLLYLLSLEDSEIPEDKKDKFDLIYPSIKSLAMTLID